ncbi:TetR/AcrR family transcriptional regulator [Promicromonospora thailandica]|uniref:Transcriptional regulator, TetR family n=1 Tax=Promicromonospora thailandica TaxID=765201 RepID=A0A9X2GDF2_9MICO|nr:TetR/AcrR family transcriptional regulator [Promicromonospora thailandica]MCP2267146.1 transcriptional regulator, TetR family [Promicromonospora thailandica]BFF17551.1 TetR/AcrR family transcriptional regulator [Promicromonospora thailandica]
MPAARGAGPASRPLRADAQRNRDAILSAARETFETEGVLASLDGIALRAGVGNATLYRNFPTRDDLLAAVMEGTIAQALADGDELAHARPPREALVEWLVRLTWQLRIWHDLPYCVATAYDDPESPLYSACNPVLVQTGVLLDAAKASGDAVDGVTRDEVFELATTLSWGVDRFGDDQEAARRRVERATAGFFV